MKNKKLNYAWLSDFDTYLEVVELAKKHGKKSGDNMQAEFTEIIKKYPKKFHMLGVTKMDIDMLAGNLREQGSKIFNLKEYERKNKRKK